MGGEWIFSFITSNKDSFDLKLYQELLIRLKNEFQPNWEEIKPRHPVSEDVYWCPRKEIPPPDNIFARFTFKCHRGYITYKHEGNPQTSHPTDCIPVWNIYWNPLIAEPYCGLSARCADTTRCIEVQKRLVDAFPNHFEIDLGDGLSGCDGHWLRYKPGKGLVPKLCPNYDSDLQGKDACKCVYCTDV